MQKGRLELNRTFGFLKRAGALALSAVMSLSLCAPAATAAEAPAQDAAEYVCGLQEHAHDASCRVVDPVGDLLSSSNYQDGYGVVYIVHQHDAACFDDGRLACVLMDGQYMAGYPNVSIVHKHDEGCTGCTLPSEPYRIGDPAVNKPGAATNNVQASGPDGDIYIGTGIGAGKDTGDTGVDDDTRTFQFHDHTDCGGDCGLPFVVRYVASASDQEGRIVCGLAEHAHSTTCRKLSVDSDGDMEAGSTGSLFASGLAKAGGGSAVVAYTNSFDNIGNEMPKTGGTGTAMIVVAGLSCLAGAAVLAVRRRGRR